MVPGRTSLQTVCPAFTSAGTSALPTKPLDPVTRIFIVILFDPIRLKHKNKRCQHATQASASGQAVEKFKTVFSYKTVPVQVILSPVSAKRAASGRALFRGLQFSCEPYFTDCARESPFLRPPQRDRRPLGRLSRVARRRANRSAFLFLWRESSRACALSSFAGRLVQSGIRCLEHAAAFRG